MGIEKLTEDEVHELLRKIRGLSGRAAKEALLGCGEAYRHVATLKNGFFISIVDDAVLMDDRIKEFSHES